MVLRGEIVNGIAIAAIMTGVRLLESGRPGRPVDSPFDLRPMSMAERRKAAGLHADMKRL